MVLASKLTGALGAGLLDETLNAAVGLVRGHLL